MRALNKLSRDLLPSGKECMYATVSPSDPTSDPSFVSLSMPSSLSHSWPVGRIKIRDNKAHPSLSPFTSGVSGLSGR